MKKGFTLNARNEGFTLIELLIVIAIIAAMAGFVVIKFTGAQAAARDGRRQSDIHQYQAAVEIYANANNGAFPSGNPTVDAISLCGAGRPLGNIPCANDPLAANPYQYSTNGGNTSYVIWARLEKPTSAPLRFYVCSNGKTGTQLAAPNNGVCP